MVAQYVEDGNYGALYFTRLAARPPIATVIAGQESRPAKKVDRVRSTSKSFRRCRLRSHLLLPWPSLLSARYGLFARRHTS